MDLKKKLHITDHGQLLDKLYSSCPDVIEGCQKYYGTPLPCCEAAEVFEHRYGICVFLPQFVQASGNDMKVQLKFPTAAEITPDQGFDMSEDLIVYLSKDGKYNDLSLLGNSFIARGSYTILALNKVSYEAVNNPPEYVCKEQTEGYNQPDCIFMCSVDNLAIQKRLCRPWFALGRKVAVYDPEFPVCDPWMFREEGNEISTLSKTEIEAMAEKCLYQCPEPCVHVRWKTHTRRVSKLSKMMLSNLWNSTRKAEEIVENRALLGIFIERLEETRIRQYFSFSLEMLVGQIGGFVGLFLGGSLISIIHVIVFTLQSMIFRNKPAVGIG